MPQLGSEALPIRIAIIGSGPSGFYAADHLLKQSSLTVQIDMFDKLPTPYGLVRGGVAPDHAKIKSVTKIYDKTAAHPNFCFYGNVEFGKDITHEELMSYYHQVIYAVGAQSDRRMGIPGEDLSGSHAATEFVGWYNAHPEFRHLQFDLSQERVAVVGNGNVAMDVARILASSYEELASTDIADYALDALSRSKVQEIYVLGRRGPAQAAFTNPEIKELGAMAEADIIVLPQEGYPDALSQEYLANNPDSQTDKNLKTLAGYVTRPLTGKPKRIHMRFLVSPVELSGNGHVETIKLVKNELQKAPDGSLRPRATNEFETLPVGLVFRSIGYMGVALPGVPFDTKAGTIPNDHGRVMDPATKQPVHGEYVVGWIKRGPSGVIGTNKPDSQETADMMMEDALMLAPLDPAKATRDAVEKLLAERKVDYVSYPDWQLLDQVEVARGQALGRPRLKFCRIDEMLSAIKAEKAKIANPTA